MERHSAKTSARITQKRNFYAIFCMLCSNFLINERSYSIFSMVSSSTARPLVWMQGKKELFLKKIFYKMNDCSMIQQKAMIASENDRDGNRLVMLDSSINGVDRGILA